MAARPRSTTRQAISQRPLWTCPRCGHKFVTRNMWHSCGRVALADHFKGKPPNIKRAFDAWRKLVRECGPFTVIPQKSRIVFMTRVRFGGAVVRKGHVIGTFWITRPAEKVLGGPLPAGLELAEFLRPKYHIYRFKLTSPAELDAPRFEGLRELAREAYANGLQQGPPEGRADN